MNEGKAYVIEKRDDEWCLLNANGGRVIGRHDSEAGAQAQERAVQAAKVHAQDLFAIPSVQIFKSGTWNGDEYSESDLDAMVAAASSVGFGIPIKAGHKDDAGQPALGWVQNLKRVGNALYADLVDLPKRVYDAIREHAFDAVSAEIFWNFSRNGKKYPRVLKALALLGAEIPAVDLEPLRAFLSLNGVLPPHGEAHAYGIDLKVEPATETKMSTTPETKEHAIETETPPAKTETPTRPGEVVVTLAQLEDLQRKASRADRLEDTAKELERNAAEYAEIKAKMREERLRHRIAGVKLPAFRGYVRALYEVAFDAAEVKTYSLGDDKVKLGAEAIVDALVSELNRQAENLFKTFSTHVPAQRPDPDEPEEIQAKIHYRIQQFCRANKLDPRANYKQALEAVLNADEQLKREYTAA